MKWDLAGETGLRITVAEAPSAEVTRHILALNRELRRQWGSALIDSVVGYTTLTVFFAPQKVSRANLCAHIDELLSSIDVGNPTDTPAPRDLPSAGELVILPVWYSPESGTDLQALADEKNLSVEQIITLHTERDYLAYANGFAPGFCYLGEVSDSLATPRLPSPRRSVPAGSVAIADRQTAVYPKASPGGWRLIGRCPLPLFDLVNNPPNRIIVGDRVRFEAIDKARFIELGGTL